MSSVQTGLIFIALAFLASADLSRAGEPQGAEEPAVVWPQPSPAKPLDRERLKAEEGFGATKPLYRGESRRDWGLLSDPRLKARAKASVALFFEPLEPAPQGRLKANAMTLGEQQGLCPGERFEKQLAAASCSGTLIAPDVILTAGHCVQEYRASCEDRPVPFAKDIHFVFGYHADGKDDPGRDTFEARQVYRGMKALGGACKPTGGDDWALVQLDRKVPSTIAEPVRELRESKIASTAEVYVMGYPSGLPFKHAGDAKVVANNARAFFVADLDTFGGNSGSGVFDAKTHEQVGILVRGTADYYQDPQGCARAYRCKSVVKRPDSGEIIDCSGEDVTRVEIVTLP